MFFSDSFRQHSVELSRHKANVIRKKLLQCYIQSKGYRNSDVQIQIDNPRMSSKSRRIGHLQTVNCFSNVEFKAIKNGNLKLVRSTSPNIIMLRRFSISEKKLRHGQYIISKEGLYLTKQRPIKLETEDSVIPGLFRKAGELEEKKQRRERAVIYLERLGKLLKGYYKKDSASEIPSVKNLDKSIHFESNKIGSDEIWSGKHPRNLIKYNDNLKIMNKDAISNEKTAKVNHTKKESKKKLPIKTSNKLSVTWFGD